MSRFFNRPAQKKTEAQLDAELLYAANAWADGLTIGGVPHVTLLRSTLEAGADANTIAANGETPLLMISKKRGAAELAKLLVDAGAWTNVAAKNGETPLLRAAAAADVETMRLLIAHDADIAATKTEPPRGVMGEISIGGGVRDIYYFIVVNNLNEDKALLPARAEALKLVMEQPGAPPCSEISFIYSSKPHLRHLFPGMAEAKELDAAVEDNDISIVKALLEKGVHPDIAATFRSDQALFTATTNGNIELMDILLKAGADINLLSPPSNLTPLQRAAWAGQKEAFDHLLTAGADPNHLGGGTGDSILSVAKSGGMEEHARTSMARRSVTVQEPITVQKPLRLKPASAQA